jgi:hypothetical protein
MLWTGIAFKDSDAFDSLPIDMSFQYSDSVLVPAMPKNLFDDCGLFRWLVCDYKKTRLYDSCIATIVQRRLHPSKVDPSELTSPLLVARLKNSRDGLNRMHNYGIIEHNIGSDVGLMRVIKHVMADDVLLVAGGQGYMMINADCNIFDRMLKVKKTLVVHL